jgi:hypothetical protein
VQKVIFIILGTVFLLSNCTDDRYRFDLPNINDGQLKFLPQVYGQIPELPSPAISKTGREMVLVRTENNLYGWMDATVENGEPFDYKKQQYGKGNQLMADEKDFPNLARKGIHADNELRNTKVITGRSVSQITIDGRPWGSSGVGFMAGNETIMSVIWADNQTVKKLDLAHTDLARPLFHLWNISREFENFNLDSVTGDQLKMAGMRYNGNDVNIKITGSRGWQESIFQDEILGTGHIEIWRDMHEQEVAFLETNYMHLSQDQFEKLQKLLFYIHTSELVFFYINRYGFYEGHTEYRPDPITVALIFGLRSIEEVHQAGGGDLYHYMTTPFTDNPE